MPRRVPPCRALSASGFWWDRSALGRSKVGRTPSSARDPLVPLLPWGASKVGQVSTCAGLQSRRFGQHRSVLWVGCWQTGGSFDFSAPQKRLTMQKSDAYLLPQL